MVFLPWWSPRQASHHLLCVQCVLLCLVFNRAAHIGNKTISIRYGLIGCLQVGSKNLIVSNGPGNAELERFQI